MLGGGAAGADARWSSFDPFALLDDGRSPAAAGIGRCHVAEAPVVAAVVAVLDEGADLGLEVIGLPASATAR